MLWWFSDGTPLELEKITTIRKEWTIYFLKYKNNACINRTMFDNILHHLCHI